jgi:hypothetical protein
VSKIAKNYKNLKHNSTATNWRSQSPPKESSADMPAKITNVIIVLKTKQAAQKKATLLKKIVIAQLPDKMADKM